MKKKLLVFVAVVACIALFVFLWWQQAIKSLNPSDTTPKIFVISRGEPVRFVAEHLQKEQLIRSSLAFFLYVRWMGMEDSIQAGDFRLNPAMDLPAVVSSLTHGTIDVWVTIPEGWRNEEIALQLAKDLGIPEHAFLVAAKEGYMFPDTYLIPKDATAGAVASLFLSNFEKKVTADIRAAASARGFSLDEVILLASLVEREARLSGDRPLVASVLHNRLKIGMKLDIDATVQYALGYQSDTKTWWKTGLTREDLSFSSPYNTYLSPGLPPGPIANPGLSAIDAVVSAPDTDYFYYVADSHGTSHFAATLSEHNQNVARYVR